MATADSVKQKMRGLLTAANDATGKADHDLTEAVASLIAGFGSGGTMLHTGIYQTEEWAVKDLAFEVPGGASYFAMFMLDMPSTGTGYALMTAIAACKSTGRVICAGSNASGSAVSASQAYITGNPPVSNYPGISFGADQVTLLAPSAPSVNSRWPQVNKRYAWIAW